MEAPRIKPGLLGKKGRHYLCAMPPSFPFLYFTLIDGCSANLISVVFGKRPFLFYAHVYSQSC